MRSLSHSIHDAARVGYGRAVDAYEKARPSYPSPAVDWVTDRLRGIGEIVEVGSGTGKFTSELTARGFDVIAVEPVAAMRERLATVLGNVRIVDATAEKLPFDPKSVQRLIASQSLHWANVDEAFAEFDRVLALDGAIALIWNFRDVSVPWQADLDELLAKVRGDAPHSRDGRWERALARSTFAIRDEQSWVWTVNLDLAGVLARVRSVSYVAALDEDRRRAVDGRVVEILARHAIGAGDIAFPYVTEAYILERRGRAL